MATHRKSRQLAEIADVLGQKAAAVEGQAIDQPDCSGQFHEGPELPALAIVSLDRDRSVRDRVLEHRAELVVLGQSLRFVLEDRDRIRARAQRGVGKIGFVPAVPSDGIDHVAHPLRMRERPAVHDRSGLVDQD